MPFDGTGFEGQMHSDLALLRETRRRLAKPGAWAQRTLSAGDARCALGWLIEVASRTNAGDLARRTLFPVLPVYFATGDDIHGLFCFNDFPSTTQWDVVSLFDRAIMRLEAHRLFHEFHG
jgi:hypothetical protein